MKGLSKTWALNCLGLLLAPHSGPLTIPDNLSVMGFYRSYAVPVQISVDSAIMQEP